MYRIGDLQDFIKELIIMSDYLFPALQKYYSALNSLERFNKEANFLIIYLPSIVFSLSIGMSHLYCKNLLHTQIIKLFMKRTEKNTFHLVGG